MAKEYKKPKSLKDITPFNQGFNSTLVRQAGLTSKYAGGDMSDSVELDLDKFLDPFKANLERGMGKKEKSDKDDGTGTKGEKGDRGEKGEKGEKGEAGNKGKWF